MKVKGLAASSHVPAAFFKALDTTAVLTAAPNAPKTPPPIAMLVTKSSKSWFSNIAMGGGVFVL